MRRGTDVTGPDRRGLRRSAIAGVAAFALILTPGIASGEPGGGGGGGGGEPPEEGAGNNLSMPVIWTDVGGPVLRGTGSQEAALTVDTDESHVVQESLDLFLQKVEGNTWQAENVDLAKSTLADDAGNLPVSYVDWGDNLEVKDWRLNQMIRVEARLLQDVSGLADAKPAVGDTTGVGMTGFSMERIGEVTGVNEMWGVVATQDSAQDPWIATEEQREEAFAYTDFACLTIERVDDSDTVKWDSTARSWTGNPVVNSCLRDGGDGPGSFGAEVTISGGLTYGFVWDADSPSQGAGIYRMTFSLDELSGVDITDETELYESEDADASAALLEEAEGGSPEGNEAVIMPDENLAYVDVGMEFAAIQPTRPVNLEAEPGIELMDLSWDPPVDEGTSQVTSYIVTAEGFQSVAVPAATTGITFFGLPGGVARTFSVVAKSAAGVSDATSVVATPLVNPATPPVPPPAVTPPEVTPPTVTPPIGDASH